MLVRFTAWIDTDIYHVTMSLILKFLFLIMQKWQRRFFILYEHGLLRYALDEMVS